MKLFSKKDESFVCENCKKEVEVLNYTYFFAIIYYTKV